MVVRWGGEYRLDLSVTDQYWDYLHRLGMFQNRPKQLYYVLTIPSFDRFKKYTDDSSSKSICVIIASLSNVTSVFKKNICVLIKIYLNISYIYLSRYILTNEYNPLWKYGIAKRLPLSEYTVPVSPGVLRSVSELLLAAARSNFRHRV